MSYFISVQVIQARLIGDELKVKDLILESVKELASFLEKTNKTPLI